MTDNDRRRQPPTVGAVLAGLFLILVSLCLILGGGGCTIFLGYYLLNQPSTDMLPMLLVSLAILAGGLGMMWSGVRLILGKRN
jgi:hypothetical protein